MSTDMLEPAVRRDRCSGQGLRRWTGRGEGRPAPERERVRVRVRGAIARSRGCHRVAMGTEQAARALGHVAFLDERSAGRAPL